MAIQSGNKNVKDTINFTDEAGLKQGRWVIKESGKIIEEGHYLNNEKVGVWKAYFDNDKLKHEINYIKGEPRGEARFYYENGKLRESGNWQVDHWEGNYKYYFESGQLSYDWFYNEKGKREGDQRYFYANGEKMYEGIWKNGKTEGALKVYDDSGNLVQERIFNDGKFEGVEKPVTKSPSQRFNGTGFHTVLNLSGQVHEKGFFQKGNLIDGEKYNYNSDGNLISITMYKGGKVVGTQKKQ